MAGVVPHTTIYNSDAISCLCKLENGSWIFDSGASDHMSFNANALQYRRLLEIPLLVSLLNAYKVQVTHSGRLKINDNLVLQHVILVSHLKYNLLSVKKPATQLQCQLVFREDLCILQGPSLTSPLAIGREAYGLYILDKVLVKEVKIDKSWILAHHTFVTNSRNNFEVPCNHFSKQLSVDVWNKRLGHIPYRRLKLLFSDAFF